MRVVLGWHFDGGAWPDVLQGQKFSQGLCAVGLGGFLGILENRLGLPTPVVNAGVRVARIYGAMRSVGDMTAFYANSFALDPWATAQRLLDMRDELVLAGWKHEGCLPRLKSMASLDKTFRDNAFFTPGFADRMQRLLEALTTDAPVGLREVMLVQHETQERRWPAPWPELFARLITRGVQITHHYASAPGGTDLGKILCAFEKQKDCELCGDGSLQIVRAATRLDATTRLPELMGKLQTGGVLIRDNGDLLLDAILQTHGLPATGCTTVSTARAAASLVRLFLQVRLLPFDPTIWHAFFQLPISPLPRYAASRLASVLESSPCMGQKWAATVAGLAAHPEKPINVNDWLTPFALVGQNTISAEDILTVLGMLEQWTNQRVHVGRDADPSRCAFHAAVRSLCRDCAIAVRALTETALSPVLLQRLLDGVLGSGLEAEHTEQEHAPWRTLTHPGQLWGRVPSVVWWAFQTGAPAAMPFWTAEEQAELAAVGVCFPEPDAVSRMEATAWLAPLRFAEQVTLVLPDREGTEPAVPHPLLDALRAVLSDAALDALIIPAKASTTAKTTWPVRRNPHFTTTPLPLPNTLAVTALSDLLQCPFKLYTEKQLRLRSRLQALPTEALVLGNLGHSLMGALLNTPDFATVTNMTALCEQKLHSLPESQALTGDVRPVFLRVMSGAAEALRDLMASHTLRYADAETNLSGALSDSPPVVCEGRLDLRFTDSHGKNVILDMKWAQSSNRYRELLEKDKDAQLAAYAGLDGNTADAGYFLLRNGHVHWHETHGSLADRWQAIRTEVGTIFKDWEKGTLRIRRTDGACNYCKLRVLCGETS